MAEAKVPVRPVNRESETESETDDSVFGQEELDALLLASIPLPDGRLIAVEALVAAIASGEPTVPATEGEDIPVVVLLDMLEKAFQKSGSEGESEQSEEDGQASFREGMNLILLGSLLESGRIGASEEFSRPQGITRRGKEKTVDKNDELRDILVDGPIAGDDIIRPTGNPLEGEFIERARIDGDKNIFESTQTTGFLQTNDLPGAKGYGEIVSVEYNKQVYTAEGGQIVIDEPGIWRLTITLAGVPGQAETGYGMYYFEQYGAYDHSQVLEGDVAQFALLYRVEDKAGKQDTASISFAIADSNPVAVDDSVVTIEDHVIYGMVTDNDDMGGDLPAGVVSIGFGDHVITAAEANKDGVAALKGAYGTLVFDFDDGYYEYYSNEDVLGDDEEPVADDFVYTIIDSDGDEDTAGLRISIVPGDKLSDEGDISNPNSDGGEAEKGPTVYSWPSLSKIDADQNGEVDGVRVVKFFDPDVDRVDIDGLLTDLGYDDLAAAAEVFRLLPNKGGVDLQVDLGTGWQTFASVSNSPPFIFEEFEAAVMA